MEDLEQFKDTPSFRKRIEDKIDHLHDCFETKTNRNEMRITILETQVGLLLKVSWLLFGSCAVVVLGSILKLVMR